MCTYRSIVSIALSIVLIFICCHRNVEEYPIRIGIQRINFPSENLNDLKYRIGHYNYEKDILAGVDFKSGTLEVWNLEKFKFIYQVPIFEDGPNRISEHLLTVYPHTLDSIFIVTLQDLIIINRHGSILYRISIYFENSLYKDLIPHYSAILSQGSYYSESRNTFYLSTQSSNRSSEPFYDSPIIASINLQNKKISTEFPKCPTEISDQFVLPFAETVVYICEDKIVYSYFGTGDLWVYNQDDFSTKKYVYGEFKKNQPNKQFGFDFNTAASEHASAAINYLCLGFNPHKNIYLRQVIDNTNRKATGKAKSSIAIFDDKFNYLGSKDLEVHCLSTFYPYKNGFIMKVFKDSIENQSDYLYITYN